jgi:hypothetical protein
MYCEDCEENFCGDCDYAFHSRKKTANHARFEEAHRPEDIEALRKEAEAEALAQQQRIAQQQQSKAGASYAAAATGAKGGVNTSASPPKPATGAAGKTGAPNGFGHKRQARGTLRATGAAQDARSRETTEGHTSNISAHRGAISIVGGRHSGPNSAARRNFDFEIASRRRGVWKTR